MLANSPKLDILHKPASYPKPYQIQTYQINSHTLFKTDFPKGWHVFFPELACNLLAKQLLVLFFVFLSCYYLRWCHLAAQPIVFHISADKHGYHLAAQLLIFYISKQKLALSVSYRTVSIQNGSLVLA